MDHDTHDLVIIGAGPAGYTAGIYAARYKLKHLVIASSPGGLMLTADVIENYPGFPSINGSDLMQRFKEHGASLDVNVLADDVLAVTRTSEGFRIRTRNHGEHGARAIIIATGSERRRLDVPGERECASKGVSYCATCDGRFFKNRTVCVVGGSDSAAKEALVLSRVASKVYVIYRKGKLRAEPLMAEKVYGCSNVEVIHGANVVKIIGNERNVVRKVMLDTGREIETNGVFIDIGFIPRSGIVKDVGVLTNSDGEIIVDKDCKTNVHGIFAAGDVTESSLKQAVTAAGDGAKACWAAFQYVQSARSTDACMAPGEG